LSCVIGLNGARSDQHIRALVERIPDQELQFARLIAATLQPGQVVPLDPQLRPAQLRAEVIQSMHGCWQLRQVKSRLAHQRSSQLVQIFVARHQQFPGCLTQYEISLLVQLALCAD